MIGILIVCIIGIIVALAVAVLLLPISISAWVEHIQKQPQRSNYRIAIRWPFSLLGIVIYRDGAERSSQLVFGKKVLHQWTGKKKKHHKEVRSDSREKKERQRGKEENGQEGRKVKTLRDKWAVIRTFEENRGLVSEVLRPIVRFLKRIIRCIRKFRVSGDIEIGVSDPALMGFLYGIFWATVGYKQFLNELKITPNYVDTVLDGWIQFSVFVTLSRIPWALLFLIIALPKRKLWKLEKKRDKLAKS